VRRVDEQHVAGLQRLEAGELDVLDLLDEQLRDAFDPGQQEAARVGLDAWLAHEHAAVYIGE